MKTRKPKSSGEADALGLLGLAHRAGGLVLGVDRTRRALSEGRLHLVLLARDASDVQLDKVRRLLRHREVPERWVSGKAALGAALGEQDISVAGMTSRSFVEQLLERLPPTPPEGPEVGERREAQEGPSRNAGC